MVWIIGEKKKIHIAEFALIWVFIADMIVVFLEQDIAALLIFLAH